MNLLFIKRYVRFQLLINHEDGQDLVEYALLVALIALPAPLLHNDLFIHRIGIIEMYWMQF
jgi:hypothetical protein